MKDRASFDEMQQRQTQCLAYITMFRAIEGRSPSLSEIQRHLGMKTKSSASQLVTRMWRRKLVTRTPDGALQITAAT